MPRKPSGPCLEPGCPKRSHHRGRCIDHARGYERTRGTSKQRGYDKNYYRLRAKVLREETTCYICGLPAQPTDPLTVDHKLSLHRGGTNVRTNLGAAHRSCNSRKREG